MSRFILLLLIVLLPLRGWAGGGMAVQMTAAVGVAAAMPADCPMMAQTSAGHDAPDAQAHKDFKAQKANCACQSCHLCMPLAALKALEVLASPQPESIQLTQHTSAYVSADVGADIKPPIT